MTEKLLIGGRLSLRVAVAVPVSLSVPVLDGGLPLPVTVKAALSIFREGDRVIMGVNTVTRNGCSLVLPLLGLFPLTLVRNGVCVFGTSPSILLAIFLFLGFLGGGSRSGVFKVGGIMPAAA